MNALTNFDTIKSFTVFTDEMRDLPEFETLAQNWDDEDTAENRFFAFSAATDKLMETHGWKWLWKRFDGETMNWIYTHGETKITVGWNQGQGHSEAEHLTVLAAFVNGQWLQPRAKVERS